MPDPSHLDDDAGSYTRTHGHQVHTSLPPASRSPVVDSTRYLDVIPPVGFVSAYIVEYDRC